MTQIYDGYLGTAINIARRYVRDYETAQDVAQESMIKVWKKQHLFDETKAKFFTWFRRIVVNTALDRYRADTLRIVLREDEDKGWLYFECPCINIDTLDLELNLNKLDVKYRVPLYLSFIEGHTQEKIAEMTGVPLGTIKSRVKIAMRELRKIYV